MSDIAIHVENLSKLYRIGQREYYKALRDTLTDVLYSPFRSVVSVFNGRRSAVGGQPSNNHIWALKDVSFEVKRGEIVGIIGRNGSGKSTLLKILSRITDPAEGYVKIKGRVGSLLEVGTGFHSELTGRENIYLNGAILGMKKVEIEHKFDEIVAFAEVEKFIDTPVKHYSSGMYMRLAFAVAAHLEPEILLVDEVLAVGDAAFQKKCLGKMGDVAKEGRTVLFVSHNMAAVTQLCERVLWLESGQLKLTGISSEVVASYLLSDVESQAMWTNSSNWPHGAKIRLKSARIVSEDGQPCAVVEFRQSFRVEMMYEVADLVRNLSVLYQLMNAQGNIVWTSRDTDTAFRDGHTREAGLYLSTCKVPSCLLRPGRYLLSVGTTHAKNEALRSSYENILVFDVSSVGYRLPLRHAGIITPLLEWEIKRVEALV